MIESFDAIVAVALSVGNTIYFVMRAEKRAYEARIRSATSEAAYSASERRLEFAEREFKTQRATWSDREKMLLDRIDFLMDRTLAPVTATRSDAPPDAEDRVRMVVETDVATQNRAMMEERITIGAEQIRAMYVERGLTISMDEARLQAESMLAGQPPTAGILAI